MDPKHEMLTPKTLLVLFAADVDIFLLMEEDQETDKDKLFTVAEIREQLMESIKKFDKKLSGSIDWDQILVLNPEFYYSKEGIEFRKKQKINQNGSSIR